jgi:heme/copper-type cytochrome/quinol oxidase subunit 3
MATVAAPIASSAPRQDRLTGTPRAHAIDRWIYVFTAASFIVICLAGFVPSSMAKIAAVQAGERPPFPLVLHMHAALMGSFLLLLLAQTTLMATGRCNHHRQLGLAALVLAPALVIVGFILVPTTYHGIWTAAQTAPITAQEQLQQTLRLVENIMLLQLRIGILFPLFLAIALRARRRDAGLHKRMMILAVAMALPAGVDRIPWLPTTIPASPVSPDLYTLLAISPMFIWDVFRNRYVHKAYWIWLGINLPFAIAVHGLWDTPWWHAAARQLMGV